MSQFLVCKNGIVSHWCSACHSMHDFHIGKPHPITDAQWSWDGNIVEPTFDPDMLYKWFSLTKVIKVCHYTLIGGEIHYHDDCTHVLKGITVWLPPLPRWIRTDACYNLP